MYADRIILYITNNNSNPMLFPDLDNISYTL